MLALWAVLSSSLALSTTLCIGSDGHVAIEPRAAAACAPASAAQQPSATDAPERAALAPLCCGPCTDVNGSGALVASRGSADAERAVPVPALAAPGLFALLAAAAQPARHDSSSPRARVARLGARSAVLRC